jgi:hypothetical protein
MNKRFLFVVILALMFALPATGRGETQRDLIYLQKGSDLRISIETYQARQGWTPVIVSVAGANVTAAMDAKGRVFRNGADARDGRGLPLFTIELEKGRILLGRESHPIRVYEQNNVRARFAIAETVIQLPVRMDQTGRNGKLLFGRLEILARIETTQPTVMPGKKSDARAAMAIATPAISQNGPNAAARLTLSRIRPRIR